MKKTLITQEDWDRVNEFNKDLLKSFITLSTETTIKSRKAYESNLRIWFYYLLTKMNNKRHIDVKPLDLKKFFHWMLERGCSSSDMQNKRASISALNIFIETYMIEEEGFENFRNFINKGVKIPQQEKRYDKQPLTSDEFECLIKHLDDVGDYMTSAYLLFSWETGARRNEVRSLRREVVNASPIAREKNGENIVSYQTHKVRCKGKDGGKNTYRSFVFGERTMSAFRKWVESRTDDNEFMFVHKVNGIVKQVGETYFNNVCKNLESIVGHRFHPHALRYSRASALSNEGVEIERIQKMLGHASPETTQIYIIKEEEDDIDDLLLN